MPVGASIRVESKNETRRHSTVVRVSRPATSMPSGWVEVDPSTTGYASRASGGVSSPPAAIATSRATATAAAASTEAALSPVRVEAHALEDRRVVHVHRHAQRAQALHALELA